MKSKPSTKKKPKPPLPFTDKGLYELDPEPTPEQRAAMTGPEQFRGWLRQLETLDYLPAKHVDWQLFHVKNAHPLLAALEAAKTPAKQKAAQAAIDRDGVASEIQRRLERFKEFNSKGSDFNAFKAGFELACAYLLASSGMTARHGKAMNSNRAASQPRKRKPNPLKAAVLEAWQEYREESGGDASPSTFVRWMLKEPDLLKEEHGIYIDEADEKNPVFMCEGKANKLHTVRRWLK